MENNDLMPEAAESKRLIEAMMNGLSVEDIVESDIVTIGINNRRRKRSVLNACRCVRPDHSSNH